MNLYDKNYKKGFTLAEVLITLAVIGVVAAMTIPALMQQNQEMQFKTIWKQDYAFLAQAYSNLKREEGDLNDYFGSNYQTSNIKSQFVAQFRAINKFSAANYNTAVNGNDLSNYKISYKSQAGNTLNYHNLAYGNFEIPNGTTFYFRTYGSNHSLIWADVNGAYKGPNVLGEDMFGVVFTKDWIKPMGSEVIENTVDTCNDTKKTTQGFGFHSSDLSGVGCSAQYLLE